MSKNLSEQVEVDVSPLDHWHLTILILCWEYPPNVVGGLSRHVYGLSTHLAEMGHEVHVITAGTHELPAFERMENVNVHRVKPLNERDHHFLSWIAGLNLAMAFQVKQLSEKVKFDIVHAHDWLVGAAAITLKQSLDIPLLTTIHATEHGRNNGIHNEIQQFIHEKESQLITESDQLIVCSEYMKNELIKVFQTTDEKLAVIPNGVEPLTVDLKAATIIPELVQRRYIFSIGRIVKEKGFDTIIEAAELAKEQELDIVFVIAGKGPMLETYQKQVSARKLDKQLLFIGYITDEQRNALIHGSLLAVIPSLYEPFGIAALETMILGKPTIVSNTGGMKGIVKHLQTGLLMGPGDAQNLLEQIDYLLNNPDLAQEIGEKGRQIVKSLYGWKRIASESSKVMEDTLLNKRVCENEQRGITK
ncbi:glycosyltransferase family 4 protein [Neobacillus jeddahensis]|uniref:glycosyltransferase family 4 protein n=1 Tax=Neobacillus jeddahensis TaxID=1461580 RepID=UPI0005917445|nr:glycosyltransferase family 4 protein [Neobacillus jeddahensis]